MIGRGFVAAAAAGLTACASAPASIPAPDPRVVDCTPTADAHQALERLFAAIERGNIDCLRAVLPAEEAGHDDETLRRMLASGPVDALREGWLERARRAAAGLRIEPTTATLDVDGRRIEMVRRSAGRSNDQQAAPWTIVDIRWVRTVSAPISDHDG